jgi:hypothetical protein
MYAIPSAQSCIRKEPAVIRLQLAAEQVMKSKKRESPEPSTAEHVTKNQNALLSFFKRSCERKTIEFRKKKRMTNICSHLPRKIKGSYQL